MSNKSHRQIALWLIVSAALLSSLIPGGPIENRDFSHIHAGVLGAFNIFLTTLDLGSIVIAYFAFRGRSWAFKAAFIAAISFFAVYAVDLAQIFPRSPTPMSFSLALVEVLGMTAAIPLMFAARRAMETAETLAPVAVSKPMAAWAKARIAIACALVLAGLGIVWFATDAAMGSDDQRTEAIDLSRQ